MKIDNNQRPYNNYVVAVLKVVDNSLKKYVRRIKFLNEDGTDQLCSSRCK